MYEWWEEWDNQTVAVRHCGGKSERVEGREVGGTSSLRPVRWGGLLKPNRGGGVGGVAPSVGAGRALGDDGRGAGGPWRKRPKAAKKTPQSPTYRSCLLTVASCRCGPMGPRGHPPPGGGGVAGPRFGMAFGKVHLVYTRLDPQPPPPELRSSALTGSISE